jgi:hypothetical protein
LLRKHAPLFEAQAEKMVDSWRTIIGAQPHLAKWFLAPHGKPDDDYKAAVKRRFVRDPARSRSAENRSPVHSVSILGGVTVFLGDFVAITDAIAERWHETSVSDRSTGLLVFCCQRVPFRPSELRFPEP